MHSTLTGTWLAIDSSRSKRAEERPARVAPLHLSDFSTGVGCRPVPGRVDNSVGKLLATGAAEQATIIMSIAADSGQLHLGWLATPLTTTATRGRIYSNGLAKFIFGHQVSSWFVLLSDYSRNTSRTHLRGNPYLVGQRLWRVHGDTANPRNAHHRPGATPLPLLDYVENCLATCLSPGNQSMHLHYSTF